MLTDASGALVKDLKKEKLIENCVFYILKVELLLFSIQIMYFHSTFRLWAPVNKSFKTNIHLAAMACSGHS